MMTEITLIASGLGVGTIITAVINKFLNRKKDTVDITKSIIELKESIIDKLYAELNRLQLKVDSLEEKYATSLEEKYKLLQRIDELENVNKKQNQEIQELKNKLNAKQTGK
jgi:peptidoglycan hydrolase CwlO-like protein